MKKLVSIFLVLSVIMLQVSFSGTIKAKASAPIATVRVEGLDGTIVEDSVSGSTVLDMVKAVLDKHKIIYNVSTQYGDPYLDMIDNLYAGKYGDWSGWSYYVKNSKSIIAPQVGMSNYIPQDGDNIVVYYTDYTIPVANSITFKPDVVQENQEFTIRFGYDHFDWNTNKQVNTPIAKAQVAIDDMSPVVTDINGEITLTYGLSKGQHSYKISGYNNGKLSTVIADKGTFVIDDVHSPSMNYSDSNYDSSVAQIDNTKITYDIDSNVSGAASLIKTIPGEWSAVSLNKLGIKFDDSFIANDVNDIKQYGIENMSNADLDKMIIGLTAAGYTPYNLMGVNLVSSLYNRDESSFEVNDAIFALAAYNYANIKETYPITKDKLISIILNKKLSYNIGQQPVTGWAYYGTIMDPDMTGAAICALSPYYNTNKEVKDAVDKAVDSLAFLQNDSGYITGPYGVSSESISLVILGLTSIGVNPEGSKFTKKNGNLVQAFMSFRIKDGQFKHALSDTKEDNIATEQAFRALIALKYYKINGIYNYYSSSIDSKTLPVYNADTRTSASVLPVTGSPIDFSMLLSFGILSLISGVFILKRRN